MSKISLPWSRQAQGGKNDADDTTWFHGVSWALTISLAGIGLYSWAERSWSVFSLALLMGLAAALVGALAGFVFGVPKTVAAPSAAAGGTTTNEYQSNTNLEEISDWLTKILVGAGLVELKGFGPALTAFSDRFRGDHGALGSFGWVVAPAVVIANSVCGFLLSYLWARIYMIQDLNDQRDLAAARAATAPRAGGSAAAGGPATEEAQTGGTAAPAAVATAATGSEAPIQAADR
jgi:hypothetical protein